MLINGAGRIGGVDRHTKTRRTKSGGAFSLGEPAKPSSAAGLTSSQSLQDVDSILSIQAVDPGPDQRQRAVDRGEEMLDILTEVKTGLLAGRIPEDRLKRLLQVVQTRVEPADDRLRSVIEEIELRAEVELAKIAKSR